MLPMCKCCQFPIPISNGGRGVIESKLEIGNNGIGNTFIPSILQRIEKP